MTKLFSVLSTLFFICGVHSIVNESLEKRCIFCGFSYHSVSNYYIIKQNNCNDILVCKKFNMNYIGGTCGEHACLTQQGECSFDNCIDINGKSNIFISSGISNPFTNCNGNGKYILNKHDKNSYSSFVNKDIIVRNVSERKNNSIFAVKNNRCLVGSGWCPCEKK